MKSWRLTDHTADLAIEATGESREEALEALCEGVVASVVEGEVAWGERRELTARGVDLTDTVVTLLGELLYTLLVERWAVHGVKVTRLADDEARLECVGEPIDPYRHHLEEVKAATYHDFHFEDDAEGRWRILALFDV